MNSYDIFKKLTRGIKFDHKRFQKDFQKFGLAPKDDKTDSQQGFSLDGMAYSNFPESMVHPDGNLGSYNIDDSTAEPMSCKDSKSGKKSMTKKKLLQLHQEKINRFRNINKIRVWGSDVPDPVDTFEKLETGYGVKRQLVENLLSQGYTLPTPVQMQVWPLLFHRRELLACAPTGSGKTAAFLLPVMHHLGGPLSKGFRAVVVSPTRELAKQTYRECVTLSLGLGLKVHFINNVNKAREKFGPHSSQKFDILITTPNRLVYLLQEENPAISLANVEWLIIDESDRLFEAGIRGFRDQLAVIYQACTGPQVHRALFSATFAPEVQNWCKLNLDNIAMVTVGIRNTACEDVDQQLLFCGDEHGKLVALRDIFRQGYQPPVLIFVQTKERAKQLFRELIYDNIMVDVIHADRTQTQRDNVVRAFRERKLWVLICTELMARGIDFKGINLVINYDFPPSIISYIHRVGRTGRAHHPGKAVTFWTMDDKPLLQSVAQVIHSSYGDVPSWMLKMEKPKKKKLIRQPDRGFISDVIKLETMEKKKRRLKKAKQRKIKSQQGSESKDLTSHEAGNDSQVSIKCHVNEEGATNDERGASDDKKMNVRRKNKNNDQSDSTRLGSSKRNRSSVDVKLHKRKKLKKHVK